MTSFERPTDFRIDPITQPEGELAEILEGALTIDGSPLNIFGVLGHHPKLLKRFNLMGGFILNKGLLPARERELVILRVGWNAQAEYEFGQHTLIGRDAGLTDNEIRSLTLAPDAGGWSEQDLHLIGLCDELHADDCVTNATWQNLAQKWNEAELVELLVTAGFYRLVSGFLNSTGVQLDAGVPGFPA